MSEKPDQDRGGLMSGLILVALGAALLLMEFSRGLGTATILVLLGAAFVVGYFGRRAYGLLITGCILLGLGGGSLADTAGWGLGSFTALGLGIGFVAISLIDLAYRGQFIWWPLIPGVALIITDAAQWIPGVQGILSVAWPAALVLIGLLLLFTALGSGDTRST